MGHSYSLIFIILFQFLILAVINLSIWISQTGAFPVKSLADFLGIFNIIIALLTIVAVFSIKRVVMTVEREAEERSARESLKQVEELIKTMRVQRHDFNNHIETIYGLVEVGEYEHARRYMEEVMAPIISTAEIMKADNPVVSALLQVKAGIAEAKHVAVEFEIDTELRNIPLLSKELNVIIGNLFDNALEATSRQEPEGRRIKLKINEDPHYYKIHVTNTGPPIPKELHPRLFERGFTTKKGSEGIGLYSVKYLAEKYGGNVKVDSGEGETTFLVEIPKKMRKEVIC